MASTRILRRLTNSWTTQHTLFYPPAIARLPRCIRHPSTSLCPTRIFNIVANGMIATCPSSPCQNSRTTSTLNTSVFPRPTLLPPTSLRAYSISAPHFPASRSHTTHKIIRASGTNVLDSMSPRPSRVALLIAILSTQPQRSSRITY